MNEEFASHLSGRWLEHRAQRGHNGRQTLTALLQVGVQHVLSGVVDDRDEREPLLGPQREPAVATAVQMLELPEAGAGARGAGDAARRGLMLDDQAGGLQGLLDEGIAEAHAVLAAGDLVEMLDIEPEIALAIEARRRCTSATGARLGEGVCRRRSHSPS
jgi:hypothetical protein